MPRAVGTQPRCCPTAGCSSPAAKTPMAPSNPPSCLIPLPRLFNRGWTWPPPVPATPPLAFPPATFCSPAVMPMAPLNVARSGHSATLFSDNNVFMVGGGTKSNEFFQASDSTFVLWPFALNEIRVGHSAIPGSDGKLLVIGGDPTGTLEQFDPATGSAPTLLLPSPSSTASLLANDKVLILGPELSSLFDVATTNLAPLADAGLLQRGG